MFKRFFVLVVLCILVSGVYAVEIPNLEGSVFYDCEEEKIVAGFTSKLISWKDLDLRIGYTQGSKWLASFSFDLKDLEKLGTDIQYAWGDTNLTAGIWVGYDFQETNFTWGFLAVMVSINF